MKTYDIDNGKKVEEEHLKAERMPLEDYKKAHESLIMACHDIFVCYKGGILLVKRENHPAKGMLWPVGGRIERGMRAEESARIKVKEECNLDIVQIKEIGAARTFFSTEPFGHGRGTDTLNIVYFAIGEGELKINELHSDPLIVKKEDYETIKKSLDPYVKDYLRKALKEMDRFT